MRIVIDVEIELFEISFYTISAVMEKDDGLSTRQAMYLKPAVWRHRLGAAMLYGLAAIGIAHLVSNFPTWCMELASKNFQDVANYLEEDIFPDTDYSL